MGLKIGDIAYLREPEGGHNAGIVSQMGGAWYVLFSPIITRLLTSITSYCDIWTGAKAFLRLLGTAP